MPERYSEIAARCLALEDKAHREAILARYDKHIQASVRHLMDGLAQQHAARVRYAGAGRRIRMGPGDYRLMTAAERKALGRQRLAAIEPEWLRRRVRAKVLEQLATIQRHQQQMRLFVEDAA